MIVITEMKDERETHKEKFWNKMEEISRSILQEERNRVDSVHELDTEIKVVKTKFGMMTIGISAVITVLINWIARKIFG